MTAAMKIPVGYEKYFEGINIDNPDLLARAINYANESQNLFQSGVLYRDKTALYKAQEALSNMLNTLECLKDNESYNYFDNFYSVNEDETEW